MGIDAWFVGTCMVKELLGLEMEHLQACHTLKRCKWNDVFIATISSIDRSWNGVGPVCSSVGHASRPCSGRYLFWVWSESVRVSWLLSVHLSTPFLFHFWRCCGFLFFEWNVFACRELNNNAITAIQNGTFTGLSNLEYLWAEWIFFNDNSPV